MSDYNPFLLADWYKIAHRVQYEKGTEVLYATWIPRASMHAGIDHVVAFGFQAFVQRYLVDYFNEHFFSRDMNEVLSEYARIVKNCLGDPNPDVSHLAYLHGLGYLPLLIKAVPEGTQVPLRVPMVTIENTDPHCFWLTNALESLFSTECWLPSTSATIAAEFRRRLDYWSTRTGGDPEFTAFQGHDFSMRGMSSVESGAASGAGHLISFSGTDSIPAILYLEKYYNANTDTELVGASVPATEHSVMCVSGRDEFASYKRLITEVYPSGIVSIVSDTWDLFAVLTDVLPRLKDDIMNRDGKVIVRPDSGNPADIVCGTKRALSDGTPAEKGVIELLWDLFGGTINDRGYKVLDPHIGAIYGDAINLDRLDDICARLAEKGFCTDAIVFGIGSFSYQYQTRDSFGFALKSTYAQVNGEEINIFKDPATDTKKVKKSLTGRVVVRREENGILSVVDGLNRTGEEKISAAGTNLLQPIFENGYILRIQDFANIKAHMTGI